MRQKVLLIISIVNIISCSPRVVVSPIKTEEAVKDYEGFIVFKEDEIFNINGDEIGNIEIKDGGLTLDCDYETVISIAKIEAQKLGANCLRIYEHRLPSTFGSKCHRIKAKAYRVMDISPFEKEIIWNSHRRLNRNDFKGSIENRPFEAATNSSIRVRLHNKTLNGKSIISVEAFFNCQNSYFKGTTNAIETMEHEQGHFDITEIYARKLRKEMIEQIHSQSDLEQKYENIYRQITNENYINQDKYDTEIYKDSSLQKQWLLKIQQDLDSLKEFEETNISISVKS